MNGLIKLRCGCLGVVWLSGRSRRGLLPSANLRGRRARAPATPPAFLPSQSSPCINRTSMCTPSRTPGFISLSTPLVLFVRISSSPSAAPTHLALAIAVLISSRLITRDIEDLCGVKAHVLTNDYCRASTLKGTRAAGVRSAGRGVFRFEKFAGTQRIPGTFGNFHNLASHGSR